MFCCSTRYHSGICSILLFNNVFQLPSTHVAEFQKKLLSIIAPDAGSSSKISSDLREVLKTKEIMEAFEAAGILTLADAHDTFSTFKLADLYALLKIPLPALSRILSTLGLVPAAASGGSVAQLREEEKEVSEPPL